MVGQGDLGLPSAGDLVGIPGAVELLVGCPNASLGNNVGVTLFEFWEVLVYLLVPERNLNF